MDLPKVAISIWHIFKEQYLIFDSHAKLLEHLLSILSTETYHLMEIKLLL